MKNILKNKNEIYGINRVRKLYSAGTDSFMPITVILHKRKRKKRKKNYIFIRHNFTRAGLFFFVFVFVKEEIDMVRVLHFVSNSQKTRNTKVFTAFAA